MIHNFKDLEKHLDSLGMFHIKPGQDRMQEALKKLTLSPLPYKAVQIVGTNGKGSTSTFLAQLAIEHGLKTGLYTSPHFLSFKERVIYNNSYIDEKLWVKCANEVYHANPELSYFEFLTVLAALLYQELQVDIVFFEAGLGGRFDATTALLCDVTVFTPFDLDHTHILGKTLKEVAYDKAHALTKNSQLAVSAVQQSLAIEEIGKVCDELDIPLLKTAKSTYQYNLSLKGNHQQQNAHLAFSAWREIMHLLALPFEYTPKDQYEYEQKYITEKEEQALKKAFIAGRLQYIQKAKSQLSCEIILDGAHNIHAFKNLITSLKELNYIPDAIIFACMADKELDELLVYLSKIAKQNKDCTIYLPVIKDNSRAMPPQRLEIEIKKHYPHIKACKDIDDCLEKVRKDQKKHLLICGSLYLLADFYTLYPQFLNNTQQ